LRNNAQGVVFIMEKYVLSVLVENHAGVLSRVSGLFSRRGYNIDSLTVCETYNPGQSRMTIVVQGDQYILEQIEKQLSKLVEVISIQHCDSSATCQREMALIKVKAAGPDRAVIIETCNIFRAHIVDVSIESVIVEATGSEDKINSLIRLLEPYGIIELAKTGLTAMDRGEKIMK
jgi:acetolactate synthase I/III small subunit